MKKYTHDCETAQLVKDAILFPRDVSLPAALIAALADSFDSVKYAGQLKRGDVVTFPYDVQITYLNIVNREVSTVFPQGSYQVIAIDYDEYSFRNVRDLNDPEIDEVFRSPKFWKDENNQPMDWREYIHVSQE